MSKHIGSSFDDFLSQESLLAQAQAEAAKRVLVWELGNYMQENKISKSALAKLLSTSRTNVNRLLDADNHSITLSTMVNVAQLIGKEMRVSFDQVRN